ncbi:hypothetical protein FRB90_000331 [Tulasnella sp. 427]|nr:hypothetical protein FRB90_000331 [Tulasnella sp. 427]
MFPKLQTLRAPPPVILSILQSSSGGELQSVAVEPCLPGNESEPMIVSGLLEALASLPHLAVLELPKWQPSSLLMLKNSGFTQLVKVMGPKLVATKILSYLVPVQPLLHLFKQISRVGVHLRTVEIMLQEDLQDVDRHAKFTAALASCHNLEELHLWGFLSPANSNLHLLAKNCPRIPQFTWLLPEQDRKTNYSLLSSAWRACRPLPTLDFISSMSKYWKVVEYLDIPIDARAGLVSGTPKRHPSNLTINITQWAVGTVWRDGFSRSAGLKHYLKALMPDGCLKDRLSGRCELELRQPKVLEMDPQHLFWLDLFEILA